MSEVEPKVLIPEKLPEVKSVNQRNAIKTLLEDDVKQAAAMPSASLEDSMNELNAPLLLEKPTAGSKTRGGAVQVATEVVKQAEKEEKESQQKIVIAEVQQEEVKKELVEAQEKKSVLKKKEKDIEANILKANTPQGLAKEQLNASKIRKELAVASATVKAAKVSASEIEGKKNEAIREKEEAVRMKKDGQRAVQKAIENVQTQRSNMKVLEGITTTTVEEFPNMCIGKFLDTTSGSHVMAICSAGPANTCPTTFSDASCLRLESINSDLTHITLKKGWN